MPERGHGAAAWRRHDLVWVDVQAWEAVLARVAGGLASAMPIGFGSMAASRSVVDSMTDAVASSGTGSATESAVDSEVESASELAADWAGLGLPLMVRRPQGGEPEGELPLGLPLPPAQGKLRLAVTLAPGAILRTSPPPRLSHAAIVAPAEWQSTMAQLVALDEDLRVFGSLAWQYLTGLDYLASGSDIDLLWPHRSRAQSEALLIALQVIEATAPMRLDGELVRADGLAVNWRELASGAEQVLAKGHGSVALMTRTDFLGDAS